MALCRDWLREARDWMVQAEKIYWNKGYTGGVVQDKEECGEA